MDVNLPNENPFRRMPGVPNPQNWIIPILLFTLILSGVSTMFYQVEAEEVGVIQRFGKYVRTEAPGLHFKLPFGIETLKRVKTARVQKEEFGFQTTRPGVRSEYADMFVTRSLRDSRADALRFQKSAGFSANSFLHESMMLTGDLNLAVVEWIVQFRYADPYKALFKVHDLVVTVRDMSEAVMRDVVGDRTVDEVITLSRHEIEQEALEKLQTILDRFDSGVRVTQVVLQNVNPPDEVKPSFNDVNTARQDKERMINQAWEDYNKFVPTARGNAEKIVREAEGYALKRINNAEGDAQKFIQVWEEYKKAQDVTRRRMFLETMSGIYQRIGQKIIIDESLQGLLPLMDVNKLAGLKTQVEGGQS